MNRYSNQKQINKRIKEGRGQGHGASYKPWIKINDISSKGRSHRIYSNKCNRIHHLLSDLELAVFVLYEWMPSVTDIREQFPLRTKDIKGIYKENKIRHYKYNNVAQVLSSDFLIDFNNNKNPQIAIQAKYSSDLKKHRVIERLQIESEYWKLKNIPWIIITEKEIPKVVFNNIEWLYQTQNDEIDESQLNHYFKLFIHEFNDKPNSSITEIAQSLDMAYQMDKGESLFWLRKLMSERYFIFNIQTKFQNLKSNEVIINKKISKTAEKQYA